MARDKDKGLEGARNRLAAERKRVRPQVLEERAAWKENLSGLKAARPTKGVMRLRLQLRPELVTPSPRPAGSRLSGTGRLLRGGPDPEALRDVRRKQTSELAKYLRTGPTKKSWSGKVIENLKVAGKLSGRLGAIGALATLPSQIEEYKEHMKPLHKREQERAAKRM